MTVDRNAYMRQYRARPEVAEVERRQEKARRRALAQLAREYPDRYRKLYRAELNGQGPPPARPGRPETPMPG